MHPLSRFRRFAHATNGLAAVEFALIAPMMVFLLFGAVDLIDALGANRNAQNVAASLADVVARDTEVSNSEMTGIWSAADILMFPESAATMDIRLTSVMVESATVARVVWSEGHNGYAALAVNSVVSLPAAMMTPGSCIIMADSGYHYTPPLGFLFGSGVTMSHTSYRRSRLVDPIPRVA